MRLPHHCLALAAAVVATGAHAQAAPATTPDPADARAGAPPLVHRSPFADYRPFKTREPASWRAVNDEVARIGGWKAYAREVYEAQKPPSPAPGEAPPAAPPHHGHGGK